MTDEPKPTQGSGGKPPEGQPEATPRQEHAAEVPHPEAAPTVPSPLALDGLDAREKIDDTQPVRVAIPPTEPRLPAAPESAVLLPAPPRIRFLALRLFVVVVAAMALALPAYRLLPFAQYPFMRANVAINHAWYQMDNEEAALLFQTQELRRGKSIYNPIDRYPYVVGTYPPVFMALNATFLNTDSPSFLGGRILSCAAAVGIAVLILSIVVLRSRHVVAALMGALLFAVTYELFSWIPYYRVDLLAIFLSVLGVGCMALSPFDKSGWGMSLVCFTLAFFTKQTQIAGPLAVILFLLFSRPRVAFRYIAYLALSIGTIGALLTILTRGEFLRHTILYNANTFHWNDVLKWSVHLRSIYRWFILAACTVFVGLLLTALTNFRRKAATPGGENPNKPTTGFIIDPLPIYMVLSLINFIAVGKAGSAENYLLEPIAAFALCTADGFGRLSRAVLTARNWFFPALATLGAAALLTFHGQTVPFYAPIMFQATKVPGERDFTAAAEVSRRVQNEQGDTWAELGIFNILANRSIFFQPFIMSELARQNKWDQRNFLADIRQRKFKLIVMTFDIHDAVGTPVLTPEMLKALQNGYELERSIEYGRVWKYYLYRPFRIGKPRLDIAQAR